MFYVALNLLIISVKVSVQFLLTCMMQKIEKLYQQMGIQGKEENQPTEREENQTV